MIPSHTHTFFHVTEWNNKILNVCSKEVRLRDAIGQTQETCEKPFHILHQLSEWSFGPPWSISLGTATWPLVSHATHIHCKFGWLHDTFTSLLFCTLQFLACELRGELHHLGYLLVVSYHIPLVLSYDSSEIYKCVMVCYTMCNKLLPTTMWFCVKRVEKHVIRDSACCVHAFTAPPCLVMHHVLSSSIMLWRSF